MKDKLFKIGAILWYLTALVTIGFGLMYFFRNDIMPYHYAFLHTDHESLYQFNDQIVPLMLAFMKIIGSSYVGIGIGMILLNAFGVKRKERWAWWAFFASSSFPLITTYIITLIVSANIESGPKPPSYLAFALILLSILGAALTFKSVFGSK
ncbi:MAG: hypothetical protein JXR60_09775 [Bacteroidales bacterium]|nr:hypothetical protein [Bacteroidales bacterium]